MISDRGTRADSLDQTPFTHNFEMSRCSGLVQPEFIGEFGYIERFLAQCIKHEDAVGIGKSEAKIGFKLGYFLFERLIKHIVLTYIRINAYLHDHHTLVMVCTIVLGVTLIYVQCHI